VKFEGRMSNDKLRNLAIKKAKLTISRLTRGSGFQPRYLASRLEIAPISFILPLKTWSLVPGQRSLALPY
jgi:hypothetical protein